MKKFLKNLLFSAYLVLAVSVLTVPFYGAYVIIRAKSLYEFIKQPYQGWEGRVHEADAKLGFKARPNAEGLDIVGNGKKIPIRYDENGFRVPAGYDPQAVKGRPLSLFLGCSFTYGTACPAEETYPYIVNGYLKGSYINAATSSYGYAQMVLLARELIPKYKPNYVFLQISPWLLERAVSMFRPSVYGNMPVPYFADVKGRQKIISPIYKTNMFDLPFEKYKKSARSTKDFLLYLKDVGMPYFFNTDYNVLMTRIKLLSGFIPRPERDMYGVQMEVYTEVYDLCRQNSAYLVLVGIGAKNYDRSFNPKLEQAGSLIVANADKALWDKLEPKTQEEYAKNYYHWGDNPPRVVDKHPTVKAHKIIADAVYAAMLEKAKQPGSNA
ncbi:MAG: hypothetical protein HQL28_01315 [Candidatus Omnitrophica bacterium]|nr:hypothetical protein [Candidatus Omnitrophota bacterium]